MDEYLESIEIVEVAEQIAQHPNRLLRWGSLCLTNLVNNVFESVADVNRNTEDKEEILIARHVEALHVLLLK